PGARTLARRTGAGRPRHPGHCHRRALPGHRRCDCGGELPPQERRGHHRRLPDPDAAVTGRLWRMAEEADGRAVRGAQQRSNRRTPRQGRVAMTSYLDDFDVDAETKQVLDLALEMTRTALGLADDFANGILAKRIIELARAGERHPGLL